MSSGQPTRTVAALVTCLGLAAVAVAAPGDLDATFGNNGVARGVGPGAGHGETSALFQQADGKLLAGRADETTLEANIQPVDADDLSVLRFDSDGTLDLGFDGDGRTSLDVPNVDAETDAVAQLADGKIVAAGTARTKNAAVHTTALAVARYLVDGRVDPSFGAGGFARVEDSRVTTVATRAVLEQNDGKIVTAGFGTAAEFGFGTVAMFLTRLDNAGRLDASFGQHGSARLDLGGAARSEAHGVAAQTDGRLIVVGTRDRGLAVVRLTADGAFDPTFGAGGIVALTLERPDRAPSESIGEAVAVQADGKIVVSATVRVACDASPCAAEGDVALVRLNADGSLDPAFGSAGRATLDLGVRDSAAPGSLVIEPSGALVVGGNTAAIDAPSYGFVARFTPGGSLDTSFGDEGATLIDASDIVYAPDALVRGVARRADGRIFVALSPYRHVWGPVTLVRLLAAGSHPGTLALARGSVYLDEGATATFFVRRSGGSAGQVSVDFVTDAINLWWEAWSPIATPGEDYSSTAGTLTWADGETGERSISIPISSDTRFEQVEVAPLSLWNATPGTRLGASFTEFYIRNTGHHVGVLTLGEQGYSVYEIEGMVTLMVMRVNGDAGPVTVRYTTVPTTATAGVDYQPVSGTLVWSDGERGGKPIVIPIVDDEIQEGTETFTVELAPASEGTQVGAHAVVSIYDTPAVVRSIRDGGGGTGWIEALILAVLSIAVPRLRRFASAGKL